MADDRDARIAELEAENAALREETVSLRHRETTLVEQQTAAAEVLRLVASSPTDLQRVLDAIIAMAVELCDALGGPFSACARAMVALSPALSLAIWSRRSFSSTALTTSNAFQGRPSPVSR